MKINYKKTAKLLTLLVTSLLIATASVQAYQALMYMEGSISIGTKTVVWIKDGTEDPDDRVDVIITGIEPNVTMSFNNTAYLKNKGSSPRTIVSIKVTNEVSNDFEICKVYVYSNSTGGSFSPAGVLNLKNLSDEITNDITLDQNECLKFDFEVRVSSTTVNDGVFTIQVTYT